MYSEFLESFDDEWSEQHGQGQVCWEIEGGVAVVVISNPAARNALTLQMWERIEEVFWELRGEDGLRAVVLRGAGTMAFAAGANIAEFPQNRFGSSQAARYNLRIANALRAVAAIEVPTIAMIRGFAVGGGCELSAACDLRIGSEDARIGIPIGRLGVILGLTESRMLVRHVGVNGLKRILFSGKLFSAGEARQLGLLDEVASSDDLIRRTEELLEAIVASSATTMRAAKVITDIAATVDDQAADTVAHLMAEAYDGGDFREGVQAFLEKRSPEFAGRF